MNVSHQERTTSGSRHVDLAEPVPAARATIDVGMGELLAFSVLAEERSFTRAAARLHLSKPGMSARIARLERAVGRRLVDRTTRCVQLTRHGEEFLVGVRAALWAVGASLEAIAEHGAGRDSAA